MTRPNDPVRLVEFSQSVVDFLETITNSLFFGVQVSRGDIEGTSWFVINGTNDNIGTAQESVWPEGGIYVSPASATVMTVSSTDIDDTALSTGQRTIEIDGLDADYKKINEIVTLNGTTAVNTVNSYLRIRRLTGRTAGSTNINEGIIYIGTGLVSGGKPANVFNLIPVDEGISKTAFYTVPAGKSAYLMDSLFTVDAGREVITELILRPFGGSLIKRSSIFVSATVPLSFNGALKLDEKTDFDMRGATTSQTAALDIVLSLLEVDN